MTMKTHESEAVRWYYVCQDHLIRLKNTVDNALTHMSTTVASGSSDPMSYPLPSCGDMTDMARRADRALAKFEACLEFLHDTEQADTARKATLICPACNGERVHSGRMCGTCNGSGIIHA